MSAAPVSTSTSLTIPSVIPFNPTKLEAEVGAIYQLCKDSKQEIVGTRGMTFTYDLSRTKPHQVSKVTLTAYQINSCCACIQWTLQIDGKEETYVTPNTELAIDRFALTGMEFEREFPAFPFPPVKSEHWDRWEERMPMEVAHYQRTIYPAIIETMRKIHSLAPEQKLEVLDLGGGSGSLAAVILEKLSKEVKQVTVVDASQKLLDKAKLKGKEHSGKLVTKHLDLRKSALPSKSAHIIVLCGVIAHQVLQRHEALTLVRDSIPVLKNKGYIIATSLSPGLLTRKDFEALGLKVHNMSLSFHTQRHPRLPQFESNEFYILEK